MAKIIELEPIKIEARTLADRVSEQIATAIVKGELPPGYKISEPELARQYGISRGPLREAIRRLEGLHLLVRIPHIGARVVSLSTKELLEIYYVREAMEGMAARLAAENMTDAEIASLRQLIEHHETSPDLLENRSYFQKEGDLDFHYRIVQGSKNTKLIELLGGELYHLVRMYRYQFSAASNRPRQALFEHRNIVEAIAQRDGELAEILMRRHVSNSRKNVEQRLQEQQLQESQ